MLTSTLSWAASRHSSDNIPTKGGDAGYADVAGTVAWENGNEQNGTVTEAINGAVLETSVRVGTGLLTSGPNTYSSIPEATVALTTYQPTTSNAGCVADHMIEYKVVLKKGLTFTPTGVEFDAVKEGTDNAYFSWAYTIDGTESEVVAYDKPKEQIRRNNNANADAPLTHKETIAVSKVYK